MREKNMEISRVMEMENNNSIENNNEKEKEWAINEIEHYLFRGAYQMIGADCSGDSRGSCARSNYGKCGEFHCCECAVKAAGEDNICPAYISHEDAREEAKKVYEKVKNFKKFKFYNDKDSLYFEDFIDESGEYLKPDFALGMETYRGTEELVWYSLDKLKKALVLISNVDEKNDDDKSKFELHSELSEKQKEKLREFCREHQIRAPEDI